MARRPVLPAVGSLVEVIRGRDRGQYAIVIDHVGDRFVLLVDGGKRSVNHPKRKNALHVRSTSLTAADIVDTLHTERRLTDAQVKYSLRVLLAETAMSGDDVSHEGSAENGQR